MKDHPVSRADNLKWAISAVLIAVFALSFGDGVIKLVSSDLSLWQIYIMRSGLALPVLLVLLKWRGRGASLLPLAFRWALLRSLLLAFMWVAYYTALPRIPLSTAAAIYYTIPLFVTLFSAWFTGDRVNLKSWMAIVTGFVGVLIIVRPDSGNFNVYLLLPLLAAILYAFAMILTRTRCRDENPLVLSLALNVTFIAMGLIAVIGLMIWQPDAGTTSGNTFLLESWQSPSSLDWLAMSVLAVVILCGSIFAAIAYQNGPASTVATFDYMYLAFSAFWGFVLFSEIPDLFTVFGMMLIVVAGIIAVRNQA